MYNNIGLLTPPQHLATATTKYKNDPPEKLIFTLTEDVRSLKGSAKQPFDINSFRNISANFTRQSHIACSKWKILTDENLREAFLDIMTPQCLDQLISLYLADELRTDVDRHSKNYFLFRPPNALRYENVIAIDLEASELLWQMSTIYNGGFSSFARNAYNSFTPTDQYDYHTYETRIKKIRQLLDGGLLSQDNILVLKGELEYDLPNIIKELNDKYQLDKIPTGDANILHTVKNIYDCTSKLWEYNRKHLGKDLEI